MTNTKHKPYPERMQWKTPVEISNVCGADTKHTTCPICSGTGEVFDGHCLQPCACTADKSTSSALAKHQMNCHMAIIGGKPCTCNADKLTPPAPTVAEVREARDAFTALIRLNKGNQATSQTFIRHAETILAALDKTHGEVEHYQERMQQSLEGAEARQRELDALTIELAAMRAERDALRVVLKQCSPYVSHLYALDDLQAALAAMEGK